MKKVKKTGLTVLVVLLALVVVYIGLNQLDGPPPRFSVIGLGDDVDTSSFESFYDTLLGPPSFDKNNGYYRLWTLTEPDDADIESDEVILKYRRLYDPQFDNEKYIKEWNENDENWTLGKKDYKGPFKAYRTKWMEILKRTGDSWVNPSHDPAVDWVQVLSSQKAAVMEMQSVHRLLLERYQKLLDSEDFEDFTLLRDDFAVPHLLAWLQVAKVYNFVHTMEAFTGDWEKGVTHLLDHIRFCKKAVKGSRTLLLNLVAKAVMRISLQGLASLMNQPEFPEPLYEKIIDGLPPLKFEEFGTIPLLLEGFNLTIVKKGGLFLQKNRTRQYLCDLVSKLVNSEKIPPYKWDSHPLENNKVKKGLFWWLQNPAGKIEFENIVNSKTLHNLFVVVFKSNSLKAVYDMTRISAELHLHYAPGKGKTVKETLEGLETYRTWLDPGSGKPYIWDKKRQILYSIGTDRKDDGGKVDYSTIYTDIVLPVVVYIKKQQ